MKWLWGSPKFIQVQLFSSFDLPQWKIETRVHTTKKVVLRFKEDVNTTIHAIYLSTIHACVWTLNLQCAIFNLKYACMEDTHWIIWNIQKAQIKTMENH